MIAGLNRKLIRRHPHVFGEESDGTAGVDLSGGEIDSARVLRNWDAIKETEKGNRPKPASILDAVPRALPALLEARKLGSRARKTGFDWPDLRGVFEKLEEETAELQEAIAAASPGSAGEGAASDEIVSEVGDLLFTAVHLARHLKVDPEFALRQTNAKFRRPLRRDGSDRAGPAGKPVRGRARRAMESSEGKPGERKPRSRESSDTRVRSPPMSPFRDPILIRMCEGLEELEACVGLQIEVWGYTEIDAIPRRAFVVASSIGGQVIGAFDTSGKGSSFRGDAGSLIGFALALPGLAPAVPERSAARNSPDPDPYPQPQYPQPQHLQRRSRPYLHSHMLAVRAPYRDRGIGRRLKLFQRQEALSRGIVSMEWTFDPLEVKNAFFNIVRLGAVARRYSPDFYGVSSSNLQGSLPTDRLYAEWWMDSPRVQAAVAGSPVAHAPVERTIVVPHEIHGWKQSPDHRDLALRVQTENRLQFEEAFAEGMAVLGFDIDTAGNGIFQLGSWEHTP